MKSNFDDVGDFHRRFGLDSVSDTTPAGPRVVDTPLLNFRLRFLEEELRELNEAAERGDHVKMFDALIDLVYVAKGTAHLFGYPWQEGWDEVQRANMTKERATRVEDSTRGSTFDVIKPPGWTPPRIDLVLRRLGWHV